MPLGNHSSQVRWAIVGTGAMGELFAVALSLVNGAVLQGVTSRSRGRAESFAARSRYWSRWTRSAANGRAER